LPEAFSVKTFEQPAALSRSTCPSWFWSAEEARAQPIVVTANLYF
jgi:hypothetical protein